MFLHRRLHLTTGGSTVVGYLVTLSRVQKALGQLPRITAPIYMTIRRPTLTLDIVHLLLLGHPFGLCRA